MERLGRLLAERGFDSFREARHQLDLTQRQANGRFTVDEAEALIERLEAGAQVREAASGGVEGDENLLTEAGATAAFRDRVAQRRRQAHLSALLDIPDDVLADELTRRGWCCIAPD